MIICIGPVCVPVHLLLAFLLSIAHRYGWFTWIKTEWVTWRFWRDKWRNRHAAKAAGPTPQASTSTMTASQCTVCAAAGGSTAQAPEQQQQQQQPLDSQTAVATPADTSAEPNAEGSGPAALNTQEEAHPQHASDISEPQAEPPAGVSGGGSASVDGIAGSAAAEERESLLRHRPAATSVPQQQS